LACGFEMAWLWSDLACAWMRTAFAGRTGAGVVSKLAPAQLVQLTERGNRGWLGLA